MKQHILIPAILIAAVMFSGCEKNPENTSKQSAESVTTSGASPKDPPKVIQPIDWTEGTPERIVALGKWTRAATDSRGVVFNYDDVPSEECHRPVIIEKALVSHGESSVQVSAVDWNEEDWCLSSVLPLHSAPRQREGYAQIKKICLSRNSEIGALFIYQLGSTKKQGDVYLRCDDKKGNGATGSLPSSNAPKEGRAMTLEELALLAPYPAIDGNWYSKEWKYGYFVKNGVGKATSTNSDNYKVGQEIVFLEWTGETGRYQGRQIYTDGKFYSVTAELKPNGDLHFSGERNARWVMRRVDR